VDVVSERPCDREHLGPVHRGADAVPGARLDVAALCSRFHRAGYNVRANISGGALAHGRHRRRDRRSRLALLHLGGLSRTAATAQRHRAAISASLVRSMLPPLTMVTTRPPRRAPTRPVVTAARAAAPAGSATSFADERRSRTAAR